MTNREPTGNEVNEAVKGEREDVQAFCRFMCVNPVDLERSGPTFFKCRQSRFIYALVNGTFVPQLKLAEEKDEA